MFEGVGLDTRINPKFFRSGIGFGGSCFPKDVNALIAHAKSQGITPRILNAVIATNDDQPGRMVALLKKHLSPRGRTIGVLGLAFKPDTDDIRESRALPGHHPAARRRGDREMLRPGGDAKFQKDLSRSYLYSIGVRGAGLGCCPDRDGMGRIRTPLIIPGNWSSTGEDSQKHGRKQRCTRGCAGENDSEGGDPCGGIRHPVPAR